MRSRWLELPVKNCIWYTLKNFWIIYICQIHFKTVGCISRYHFWHIFSLNFWPSVRKYTGTSIKRRAKGLAKYVRYTKVSLYRGTFSRILLLLWWKKSFVIPRTSLYGGSTVKDTWRFSCDKFLMKSYFLDSKRNLSWVIFLIFSNENFSRENGCN